MTGNPDQQRQRTDLLPDQPPMKRPRTLGGWCKAALQVCSAIGVHSMFLMSIGNNALAYGAGGLLSGAISLAGTLLIAFTVARQKITGRDRGMPYYSLAGVNALSAFSILQNISGLGFVAAWPHLIAAASLLIWGVGHALRGYQFPRGMKPKSALVTPIFYTGVADAITGLRMSASHPWLALTATSIALIGTLMTLRRGNGKHAGGMGFMTPAKVLAAGYALQTVATLLTGGSIYFMIATAFWTAALVKIDREESTSRRRALAERGQSLNL